jgi:hypothetical protein
MGGGNGASGPQEPRATIYYTTDGTDPNPRFALTAPLQLDVGPGTTHVKAMAWARGCAPSPVVHAKFVVYGDQDSRCVKRVMLHYNFMLALAGMV